METFGARTGNYHETTEFSHPRLGISAITVNGKAFAAITDHGIQMVKEGHMDFKPLKISDEWLDGFNFEPGVWRKLKLPTILDGGTNYLGVSKMGDRYLVFIEEHAEQYLSMKDLYEILREMIRNEEDIENLGFLKKEQTVNLGFVEYVHELQNLYNEIAKGYLTYNSK